MMTGNKTMRTVSMVIVATVTFNLSTVAAIGINNSPFDLSNLDNSKGVVINGISEGNFYNSGSVVSRAGDVNGDGFDDILIGGNVGEGLVGQYYVVYGSAAMTFDSLGVLELSDLDGSNGFTLEFGWDMSEAGMAVSGGFDFNNDGFSDLIIGVSNFPQTLSTIDDSNAAYSGISFLVYGGPNIGVGAEGRGGHVNISSLVLDGSKGFKIIGGDEGDWSGTSVSNAGDVNGDGYDDIIIGAKGANGGDDYARGASYVLFGGNENITKRDPTIQLSTLNYPTGFTLNGINHGDQSGSSVASAGDVNKDGLADFLISAPYGGVNETGEVYLVYGSTEIGKTDLFELSELDGSNGFVMEGISDFDNCGQAVSGAGDVNGDGYDDVLIGAYHANSQSGEVYLVYGFERSEASPSHLKLKSLEGSNGFKIRCSNAGKDWMGYSVASAGDINADGYSDFLIGAPAAKSHAGKTYLVYGNATVLFTENGGILDLDNLDITKGIIFQGESSLDHSGCSVSSAGDFNQDGYDDVFIGAKGASSTSSGVEDVGVSYVIYGFSFEQQSDATLIPTLTPTLNPTLKPSFAPTPAPSIAEDQSPPSNSHKSQKEASHSPLDGGNSILFGATLFVFLVIAGAIYMRRWWQESMSRNTKPTSGRSMLEMASTKNKYGKMSTHDLDNEFDSGDDSNDDIFSAESPPPSPRAARGSKAGAANKKSSGVNPFKETDEEYII